MRGETRSFLRAAEDYCAFIEATAEPDGDFLVQLERLLLDLYTTATTLRWPPLNHGRDFDDTVPDDALAVILNRIADRVGADRLYWEVFDPFDHEHHEPVCGDLVDDLGDIYRDIKAALIVLGHRTPAAEEDAMWQLKFGFENHWGRHAIGALTAVHHLLRRR